MGNLEAQTPLLSSVLGFFTALVFLFGFYIVRKREERRWLMGLAIVSFLLKAMLVPLYFQLLVWAGEGGFAYIDAPTVHIGGIRVAEELEANLSSEVTAVEGILDPGPFLLTGYLYWFFGPNTLVYRFFTVMCVSMSLLYVYRIARLYFDEATARMAAGLQAFIPMPILNVLNHRKDSIVQLMILFIFYHSLRVFRQESGWPRSGVWIVLGLMALYPFRSGVILPLIGIMLICFVLANRSIVQGFALGIVTVIALVGLQLTVSDDSRINLKQYTERADGKLLESAELSEVGGVARLMRVTGLQDIYKVPFAALAYLILPFPPSGGSGYLPTTLAEYFNLAGVFLLPHMLLGAWSLIRGPNWRPQLPLLVFPVVFLLLLGIVHIGAFRYKLIFYPICLLWAAIGWQIGTGLFLKLAIYGGLVVLAIPVYMSRFGLF